MNRKKPLVRKDGGDDWILAKKRKTMMEVVWKKKEAEGERRLHFHEFSTLFHYCVIGAGSRKPYWCSIRNFKGSSSVILLRLDCTDFVMEKIKKFKFLNNFFKGGITIKFNSANREDFWLKMLNVADGNKELIRNILNETGDPFEKKLPEDPDDMNRLHLLVSLADMAQHNYQIPGFRVVPSKEMYKRVSKRSPIFVIDCEMCLVESGANAVTRVSILDECGNVVLDTLVVPEERITDYVTCYSGITKAMLDDVKTSLKDIHEAIKVLLPDDAILCGHSLNFDLEALGISHPYCIDIALLYNLTGDPHKKTGLRNLSKSFLKREIQNSKKGHCSVEDCRATLDLLKEKFSKGYAYGNVIHGFSTGSVPRREIKKDEDEDDDTFVQTPVNKEKSESKSKYCSNCKAKFATICSIDGCSCKTATSSKCAKCLVKEAKDEKEKEGEKEIKEGKLFDWIEITKKTDIWNASCISKFMTHSMRTMFCAIKDPIYFIKDCTNAFCKFLDASKFKSFNEYITQVGPTCIEHKMSLLEHDLDFTKEEELEEADKSIKYLIEDCIMQNSLCSVVFATEKESIGFVKVKD
ncbi:hypothetical protein FO519_006106 [Halicephalobus sp. NKZ332]|nr:hypothetical protein FO519_006106 [Halicephalobus sp. NKZ332]